MIRKLSKILFSIVFSIDKIFFFLTKRSFLEWFPDFWQEKAYTEKKIANLDVNFFIPNNLIRWRVDTLYSKEPDTIEWINNFKQDEHFIFWDIGANIGLYSIYNAIKNKNCSTFAFEPSTNNLRILSRNIFINNLDEKIKIFTNPLGDKDIMFLNMKEKNFYEGSAFNDCDGKLNLISKKKYNNHYQVLGMSIEYILNNKILLCPDYMKIDVDGNEELILKGAGKFLKNKKIKSILCEIDENNENQKNTIIKILKSNDFVFESKRTVQNISNFIFNKK